MRLLCFVTVFVTCSAFVFAQSPHYLPFSKRGTCYKGQKFKSIKSIADLRNLHGDLECLYAAGITPSTIPLGPFHGDVLELGNGGLFTPMIQGLWSGKLATSLRCGTEPVYISWNVVGNSLSIPALLRLGNHNVTLSPKEYDDGKGALIIDYTQDFSMLCRQPRTSDTTNIDFGILNNVFPFNQIVDAVRLVGRDQNNMAIYLGKTFLKSMYRADHQGSTIAFWTIRSFDAQADPWFQPGDTLPPLTSTFNYSHPGPVDIVFRVVPVQDVLQNPHEVLDNFLRYNAVLLKTMTRLTATSLQRGLGLHRSQTIGYLTSLISGLLAVRADTLTDPSPIHIIKSHLEKNIEIMLARQESSDEDNEGPYEGTVPPVSSVGVVLQDTHSSYEFPLHTPKKPMSNRLTQRETVDSVINSKSVKASPPANPGAIKKHKISLPRLQLLPFDEDDHWSAGASSPANGVQKHPDKILPTAQELDQVFHIAYNPHPSNMSRMLDGTMLLQRLVEQLTQHLTEYVSSRR